MTRLAAQTIALFAHPDDEIGLYPWVVAARAQQRKVICVWLTDGGWGGQSVERRCAESRKVLARLGVDVGSMFFAGVELGIADGGLHLRLDDAVDWLLRHFDELAPDTQLWLPAWEGGHADHDAAHLAGQALAHARGLTPMQYSLYQGKGLPRPWFRVITPLTDNGELYTIPVSVIERVRCILRCFAYRSQWRSFIGLLPFYALRMLHRYPFALQAAPWGRTAERPHDGEMLYERRGGPTWEEFARVTSRWRASGRT
ncbi:MAG: PIG-L deacetylase family protein [Pseudomonadota bacterium]